MRKTHALHVVMLMGLMGCGEQPSVGEGETGGPTEVTFAPAVDVSLDRMTRLPSGLYIEDVTVGQGAEAMSGQTVVVHYTGWLPDGTEFDSSRTRNDPFVFDLGAGEVISGWDQGVAGMRVGGRRKLVIPPDLAYGAGGAGGVIPPNATLVFDVELLDVR
ncbi:hypothetical protein BH23GEM6_BH23GEM6_24190 [soil metagenome]